MKPIKLRMKNFGPYVDETVDFSAFFDAAVFLISGKTGTGKTTIFDAMCFALFGQTSGNERDAQEMRSDFASDQDLTEVMFEFEDQQKTYQITRSPKQTVASKRGNGQTERAAKVSLIYRDVSGEKREIDKINQANQFISDLLNLTAEQFSQIVILPQGQFRNFLSADSNSKETVLRELFGTEFYQRFVDSIKERNKERQAATKQQLEHLHELQKNVQVDKPGLVDLNRPVPDWLEQLALELKKQRALIAKYQAEYQENDQQKTKLDRLFQTQQSLLDDQNKLAEYQKQAQGLENQKPQFDQLQVQLQELEWANKQQATLKDYTDAADLTERLKAKQESETKKQATLQQELAQNKVQQKHLTEIEPQIEKYQGQIERLKDKVALYQKVEQLQADHQKMLVQVTKQQKEVAKAQEEVKQSKKRQAKLEKGLQEYADLHQQELQLQAKKDQIENLEQKLADLKQAAEQKNTTITELKVLKTELIQLEENVQAAQDKYQDLDAKFAADQIVSLAARLKPGQPCPLCGATDHPHPANVTTMSEPVTKQQVKAAQKVYQNALAAVNTQKGTVTTREKYLTQQDLTLKKQQAKLVESLALRSDASLDNVIHAVQASRQQLVIDTQTFDKRQATSQKMQERLAALQQQQTALENASQTAAENCQQAKLAEQKLAVEYAQTKEQLPKKYASSQELQEQLKSWNKSVTDFKQQQQTVQKEQNILSNKIAAVESGLKERTQQLKKAQIDHAGAQEKLKMACQNYSGEMDLSRLQTLSQKLDSLTALRGQLEKYHEQLTINQTKQKQLAKRIADRPTPQIEQTKKQITQIKLKQDTLFQQRSKVNHIFQQNQDTYTKVSQIWQDYQSQIDQDQQWTQLAEVISGKGKLKLNIERYVLQSYFRQVLEVANQRFAELTSGRYSFCLDDKAGSYASNTGLELNIYDDNAGKIRSVRTLSGGESFIAALCLALALGEVVSAQAGGVSVEALFVDEGFGSLDTDSLQMALDALRAIEGENRLIGIISHVTELRTEIPDQLHVLSENGRSSLKYEHEFEE